MNDVQLIDPENIDPSQFKGYKGPVLRRIFFRKYDHKNPQDIIPAPILEVIDTIEEFGLKRPGNIHNCFKDIVRNGKMHRDLGPIVDLNYEIRQVDRGGEFINSDREDLRDIIDLPEDQKIIKVNSASIPAQVIGLIRTDEGGILSAVEYSEILNQMTKCKVLKVQSPIKVQPNEIDGGFLYEQNGKRIFLSIEVKSKGSDVLLKYQLFGGAKQAQSNFGELIDKVIPIGIKLERDNSIYIVRFPEITKKNPWPQIEEVFRYYLSPTPESWLSARQRKEQQPLL